jgi:hypothetical protein
LDFQSKKSLKSKKCIEEKILMPILKSGRAVGIYQKNYIDEIRFDEDGELESFTFGYRPAVHTTRELLNILPIYYYDVVNGIPILESPRKSGFMLHEIFSGADHWSDDEITEFDAWINSNTELDSWLKKNLILINEQEENDLKQS